MNYAGFDIHAHNRATRRFSRNTRADLVSAQPIDCPFCGAATTANEGRIAQHIEHMGFTMCPGSGVQPYIAAERAATLTADYRLPRRGLAMTETTWTPATIALSKLKPWERNPKRISKAHAARLLDLWERLGQFQTIAIGPDGEVYDGHQRLSVLKAKHGGSYVVQVLQASRPLTEAEREELTIAAHSGTTGSWDWDALAGWDVGNLQGWGFDTETLTNWQTDIGALRTMIETTPDFQPVEESEQPRLDQKAPITCPHCGMEFVPE